MEQRRSAQLGTTRQQCDRCAYSTDHTRDLTRHQRTHTGEKPFKCSVCGKAFAHSSSLVAHQRTHTGEKPFKCSVCGKAFAHSSSLVEHQRAHTGEKPFKCSVCVRAFSRSSALVIHKRTHTGEKPFRCTLCRKVFTQSANLIVHQKTQNHQKIHKEWSLTSACESQSAAMSPSLTKYEPEENPSLDTFKGIEVKYDEMMVKCEEVMVKNEEMKVNCEDEDSTPQWYLHIDGGTMKRGENSDCEAARGNSQQFMDVWMDFLLDNTMSRGDPVDV